MMNEDRIRETMRIANCTREQAIEMLNEINNGARAFFRDDITETFQRWGIDRTPVVYENEGLMYHGVKIENGDVLVTVECDGIAADVPVDDLEADEIDVLDRIVSLTEVVAKKIVMGAPLPRPAVWNLAAFYVAVKYGQRDEDAA